MGSEIEVAQEVKITAAMLSKGQYIEAHEIAAATNTKAGTTAYQFARLKLAMKLRLESWEGGNPLILKGEGDGLRVLVDEEAVQYTALAHERHLRGLFKAMEDLSGIDVSKLDSESRALHRVETVRQSRIWQAIKDEAKQLEIEGIVRSTPPMLSIVSGDTEE